MSKENNNEVFFGYYDKSDRILGVSKSDQSDAKFLRGAFSIEKVEVRRSAEVQKDLRTAKAIGKCEGYSIGTLATAAMFGIYELACWCFKKIDGWFKKEE